MVTLLSDGKTNVRSPLGGIQHAPPNRLQIGAGKARLEKYRFLVQVRHGREDYLFCGGALGGEELSEASSGR